MTVSLFQFSLEGTPWLFFSSRLPLSCPRTQAIVWAQCYPKTQARSNLNKINNKFHLYHIYNLLIHYNIIQTSFIHMDDEFDEWQEALPAQPSQSLQIEYPLPINEGEIQQQSSKVQNQKQEIIVKAQISREKSLYFNENLQAEDSDNIDNLLKYKSQPIITFQNFNSNHFSQQAVDIQQREDSNFNPSNPKQVHLVENHVQQTNVQLNANFKTSQKDNQETINAEQSNEIPQAASQNNQDQFGQFSEPTSVTPQQIANSKDIIHSEHSGHSEHSEHERYEREKQKQVERQRVRIAESQNVVKIESFSQSQMNSSGVFSKPKIKKPVYSQLQQKRATELIKKIPDYSFISREQFMK